MSPKQHFLPLEKSGKRRLWELSIQGIVLFKTKVNDDIPAVCGKTKQRYVASDRGSLGMENHPPGWDSGARGRAATGMALGTPPTC